MAGEAWLFCNSGRLTWWTGAVIWDADYLGVSVMGVCDEGTSSEIILTCQHLPTW